MQDHRLGLGQRFGCGHSGCAHLERHRFRRGCRGWRSGAAQRLGQGTGNAVLHCRHGDLGGDGFGQRVVEGFGRGRRDRCGFGCGRHHHLGRGIARTALRAHRLGDRRHHADGLGRHQRIATFGHQFRLRHDLGLDRLRAQHGRIGRRLGKAQIQQFRHLAVALRDRRAAKDRGNDPHATPFRRGGQVETGGVGKAGLDPVSTLVSLKETAVGVQHVGKARIGLAPRENVVVLRKIVEQPPAKNGHVPGGGHVPFGRQAIGVAEG